MDETALLQIIHRLADGDPGVAVEMTRLLAETQQEQDCVVPLIAKLIERGYVQTRAGTVTITAAGAGWIGFLQDLSSRGS